MSRVRRTFSPELKLEAGQLIIEQGHTVRQACQAVGFTLTDSNNFIAMRR